MKAETRTDDKPTAPTKPLLPLHSHAHSPPQRRRFPSPGLACTPPAFTRGLRPKAPSKEDIHLDNPTIAIENSASKLTLSPTSLVFGDQTPGTTSPGKSVIVTNSGSKPLTITSIALSSASGLTALITALPR